MRVRANERHALALLIEREQQRTRARLLRRCGCVVEDADETAAVLAHVVLPFEPRARAEREGAALAAEPPQHAAAVPLDLVRGPGVAARHDQIPVRRDVD